MEKIYDALQNPLVSIIVITYNSSKFVLETLESAKAQTYQNIELIVSDDCSTDNTVEICCKWIESNKDRFVRTELVTVEANTGIPANCNRGVRAAQGEWVKLIAGDDVLINDCIENNVRYVMDKPNIKVLFSQKAQYINTFNESNFYRLVPKNTISDFFSENITANKQYEQLIIKDRIGFTATSFMQRDVLINVGLFDERLKLIEDYPMWLKLTKDGHKLYFMLKLTIKHRMHENAVFNTTNQYLIKPAFIRNEELRKVYTYPYMDRINRLNYRYMYGVSVMLKNVFFNKSTKVTRGISKILLKYINPFYYLTTMKNNK